MEHFKVQTASVDCPSCGKSGHAIFGQTVIDGRLRWYRSISCPASGNIEEDGIGGGPPYLRNELLASMGSWSVRLEGVEKTKAVRTVRRLLSLSNDDTATLLRSHPNLLVGTKAEADWLMERLAAEGLKGEVEASTGNGS